MAKLGHAGLCLDLYAKTLDACSYLYFQKKRKNQNEKDDYYFIAFCFSLSVASRFRSRKKGTSSSVNSADDTSNAGTGKSAYKDLRRLVQLAIRSK
jgi:hypothetical protein